MLAKEEMQLLIPVAPKMMMRGYGRSSAAQTFLRTKIKKRMAKAAILVIQNEVKTQKFFLSFFNYHFLYSFGRKVSAKRQCTANIKIVGLIISVFSGKRVYKQPNYFDNNYI